MKEQRAHLNGLGVLNSAGASLATLEEEHARPDLTGGVRRWASVEPSVNDLQGMGPLVSRTVEQRVVGYGVPTNILVFFILCVAEGS